MKRINSKGLGTKSGGGFVQIGAIIGLVILGTFLIAGIHSFDESKQSAPPTPSPIPTPTPKPTTTPTIEPTVKETSNSDPIITCYIHANCGGGSRQMKKSECEKMTCCLIDSRCGGNKFKTVTECINSYCCLLRDSIGKLLDSKSACDNYYPNNSEGGSVSNIPTKNYYPCTLCYHYSSGDQCTTYNYLVETKAECDAKQAKIDSSGSSYIIPASTPSPTPPVIYTPSNSQLRAECQSQVRDKYRPSLIQYGCTLDPNEPCEKYDPTSACCAVKDAYKKEIEKCSQLYP